MTREEAITNLKMIRVAFVEPITEEQAKLIDDTFDMAIKALEQKPCEYYDADNKTCRKSEVPIEPCEDCISRESLKQKLQEHHDFFVNAYDGFSKLPQNDKSRVDEINSCIAMVVNEPYVTPQKKIGHWKGFIHSAYHGTDEYGEPIWREVTIYHCNQCNRRTVIKEKFCPNCGAKMESEE